MSVSCRVARSVPCPVAVTSRCYLSLRAIPYRCRSRLAGKARDCAIGHVGVCVSSPLVYRARPFYLCLVRHSQDYLCSVSSVANVESNEYRYFGSHSPRIILHSLHSRIALFCILLRSQDGRECFEQFKTFASVRKRGRMQNNAILEWIMRGEYDPKYRYSLIVSHYSLQSPHSHSSNFWIFNQGNHWKNKQFRLYVFWGFSERTPSMWHHIKISPVYVFACQKYSSLNMGMNLAMAEVITHVREWFVYDKNMFD